MADLSNSEHQRPEGFWMARAQRQRQVRDETGAESRVHFTLGHNILSSEKEKNSQQKHEAVNLFAE